MTAEKPPLSYAIIGAGALGGLYGGMLARAGAEVHFLVRGGIDEIRRNGWIVESVRGDFTLPGDSLNLHGDPESLPPCDVTLVALKTTANRLLPRLLAAPTSGGGIVLCLQNGLNSDKDCAAVVGRERVLGGCCFLCSNKLGPGHIRHLDYGRIVMGEFAAAESPPPGITDRLQRVVDDLRSAEVDAHATEDLWAARWRKLMWNIPFNGLSVVLDASTKELIEDAAATELAESMMIEVRDAAAACGRRLPDEAIETTLAHTRNMVPYDSSMRLDYLAGREMELEAIFRGPIEAARSYGRPMARVEVLYRQLSFLQSRRLAKVERLSQSSPTK